MPSTPTGYLSAPLASLRDMLADSTAFRAWVGVSDAAAARLHIHLLVAPVEALRPFVMIDFGAFARERDAVTNRRAWSHRSGSDMLLWFQADVPPATVDDSDATIDFCNVLGAVWADLEKLAGIYEEQRLALNLMELVVPPIRVEEEKRPTSGDYFEAAISAAFTRQP